jgi:hypothetical protein
MQKKSVLMVDEDEKTVKTFHDVLLLNNQNIVPSLLKELLQSDNHNTHSPKESNETFTEPSSNELLQLNYLIHQYNQREKEQNVETLEKKGKETYVPKQIVHTNRPHMENDIDPLWYLVYGPLILFEPQNLSKLTLKDMVDYYRAYPTLNWSKYPLLYNAIINQLTEEERMGLRLQALQQRHSWRAYRLYYKKIIQEFSFRDFLVWIWTLIRSFWNKVWYRSNVSSYVDIKEQHANPLRRENEQLFSIIYSALRYYILQLFLS